MGTGKVSAASKIVGAKRDDPAQSEAFIEKAREIGADEDKSAADGLIARLAQSPPDPKTKKK
jgi:hypothetical protein